MAVETYTTDIEALLGDEAEYLLQHRSETFPKESLHLPGPDFVDRVVVHRDRNVQVLRNLQGMFSHGRLGGTGYVSILPVDQGIEHSAGASFAPNPEYFDPEKIVELAVEGGCNAVASTFGVLGMVARKWATKIPFIVKLNHNEMLSYPNTYDQTLFGNVHRAWEMGATGVGATIYLGSEESRRQLLEISEAFSEAHDLGMFTVLWCYVRNSDFKQDGTDYSLAADLTGQANHLGVTIEADIIKQKLPENNGGFTAIGFGKTRRPRLRQAHDRPPDRPHPLPGGQLLHGPRGPDQLGRRVQQGLRQGRGRPHRGDQQARRRHRPDLGPQGVPAADGRGRRDPQRHPGRLPLAGRHDRVAVAARTDGWVGRRGAALDCAWLRSRPSGEMQSC